MRRNNLTPKNQNKGGSVRKISHIWKMEVAPQIG